MSADTNEVAAGIVPQRTKDDREKGKRLHSWFVPKEETVGLNQAGYVAHVKQVLRKKGFITGFEITPINHVAGEVRHVIRVCVHNGPRQKVIVRAINAVRNQTELKGGSLVLALSNNTQPSGRKKKQSTTPNNVARGATIRPTQVRAAMAGGNAR